MPDYDVIVIGGGINGAGVARDAARRGLSVLLLEKDDFGAQTTGYSTRLIHGGLRYLEHGEIGLVRESLQERERLLAIAPHLVRPLAFLLPVYRNGRRGPWAIRAGMRAYDLLAWGGSLPGHRILSAAAAREREPGLAPRGLCLAALYTDGQAPFVERLVWENVADAERHGAVARNGARVERLETAGNRVSGVRYRPEGGEARRASAGVIVNCAGPWADLALAGLEGGGPRLIGGTKGSHLVVSSFPGAPRSAVYAETTADGRPFFVVPFFGQYLIGTTDLPFSGDPDEAAASAGEIDYLLEAANRTFPRAGLTRAAVGHTCAGVRPLPAEEDKPAAARSRRHHIHAHGAPARGLFSLIGGKLTTYRLMAEQTVDRALEALGRAPRPCDTESAPLPGGETTDLAAFADAFRGEARGAGLEARSAEHLLAVHGARARAVLALARRDERLAEPFCAHSGAIGAQLVHALEAESARGLTDALRRRTMVGLGPRLGLDVVERAAGIAGDALGWSEAERAEAVEAYRAAVATHRVASSAGAGAA